MKRKIIITMKTSRRLTTFCLTGALTLAASGGALASGNDAALQALFAQANYWHEKSHDELAMESLQKVLSVDANNTRALYLMALWSQQGGDMQAAAQWRARLAKAALTARDYRIWTTPKDVAGAAGPAQPGPPAGARRQYPRALATAQYVQWQYAACRAGGGILPDHGQRQIALSAGYQRAAPVRGAASAGERPAGGVGQSVNRREETRREGIALLEPMASGNKEADSGLRQALLWLGPQAGDEQYYDTGCSGIPVTAKFRITFANGAAVRRAARATPTSTAAIPPPRSSSLKRYCRPTP